jgi:hypothetical protein
LLSALLPTDEAATTEPPASPGGTAPVKRAHHFIPRFHLAQFIGYHRGRQLAVYDKQFDTYRRRPVKATAFAERYYEVPGPTPADQQSIEDQFAQLESHIAPMLRRLADLPVGAMVGLSDSDRHSLSLYAAVLHVRLPAYRDQAMARLIDLSTDLEALGLDDPVWFLARARALGMEGSDELLEQQRAALAADILSGRRLIVAHPAASLAGLVTAVGKGAPLLIDRHWQLLRTDDWPGLVLGDQPVTLFQGGRIAPSIGFGTAGVEVMMPLSPRMLLVISDKPREPVLQVLTARYPRIGEPWWCHANKVAWLTSQRFVYGQKIGHLQAAGALIPADQRRRDFRILDSAQQAAVKEVARQRRAARRAAEEFRGTPPA